MRIGAALPRRVFDCLQARSVAEEPRGRTEVETGHRNIKDFPGMYSSAIRGCHEEGSGGGTTFRDFKFPGHTILIPWPEIQAAAAERVLDRQAWRGAIKNLAPLELKTPQQARRMARSCARHGGSPGLVNGALCNGCELAEEDMEGREPVATAVQRFPPSRSAAAATAVVAHVMHPPLTHVHVTPSAIARASARRSHAIDAAHVSGPRAAPGWGGVNELVPPLVQDRPRPSHRWIRDDLLGRSSGICLDVIARAFMWRASGRGRCASSVHLAVSEWAVHPRSLYVMCMRCPVCTGGRGGCHDAARLGVCLSDRRPRHQSGGAAQRVHQVPGRGAAAAAGAIPNEVGGRRRGADGDGVGRRAQPEMSVGRWAGA
eukprot:366388-Chlamydomonas_euryale.AAC.2